MAGHVFVSYATADIEVASRICSALEAKGIRCWIAPRDIQPGSDYGATLLNAIGGSALVVLVLSTESNGSPHVRREIERAASKGITIVPFVIERVELSKSLEFFISAHHWLDATNRPLEPHVQRLVESVERVVCADARLSDAEPVSDVSARRLRRKERSESDRAAQMARSGDLGASRSATTDAGKAAVDPAAEAAPRARPSLPSETSATCKVVASTILVLGGLLLSFCCVAGLWMFMVLLRLGTLPR